MDTVLSGLIGAIVGAVVTAIGSFITVRFQYRDMYAKTVSSNRMDWINHFREEVGIIVACLRSGECKKTEVFEAEKARAKY